MATAVHLFLLLPVLAHAQNDTSAHQDPGRVGWVSSADVRGTSDILWSCGAIFLVCTWKCMHFNLPSHEQSEAQWHTLWGWLPYWPTALRWRAIRRLAKWMCIIAIAPEFGIAMAADEWWHAWKLTTRVGSPGFTVTHAFYALMGGFVIAVPAPAEEADQANEVKVQADTSDEGATPCSLLQKLQYFSIQTESRQPDPGLNSEAMENYELIDPVALSIFKTITQETESATCFPRVTEEDIENQAKSDPLTKAFAVLQCTWLIVQSIARASQGLPLTELELTTLAFTVCAFIMYGFWWCKPFDVRRPTRLLCSDPETVSQIRSTLNPWNRKQRTLTTNLELEYILGVLDLMKGKLSPGLARSVVFHTSAVAFSAIHLIAWNWEFPSPVVCNLWRAFSLGAACIPLITFPLAAPIGLCMIYLVDSESVWTKAMLRALYAIFSVMAVAYVICRLGIIVLIFYCFTAMPASVYETASWHSVFPHFS
ncbi:hypothetical protein BJY00DRAFT_295527 [Aspergillus carlsbadensis]|nr:hypothetical protein BJY00DRAFT_295527 [Aspergillus carlsbadensis]